MSSEASAEPGRWKTSRAPYQREMLDAVNDPRTENVVIMSSAQIGKTELILNIIGYYISYDSSPILLVNPTVSMSEAFSKDRLSPMIRDSPALRVKVADVKSKSSGNTVLHKSFTGGHITMAGANSPAGLASRPIRILLVDELDRFPPSAGTEGDPFLLAKRRTNNFYNKKVVVVSTPTVKGASRIETLYEDSTQEQYCLPCPSCETLQPLKWPNIVFATVSHTCEHCGALGSQHEWTAKEGTWIARNPSHKTRGFHLNELVSPWRRWEQVIEDFLQAKKSPETLKTFVNTSLGETFEVEGATLDHSILYNRRESYPSQVPMGGLVLVAGVDLQEDRVEIGIEAFGHSEENWKIDFIVLRGDPAKPELWQKVDDVLSSTYQHESGVNLPIACCALDSGGHHTQQTYAYVKTRESRRIFAIKGRGGEGMPVVSRPNKSNLGKINLFSIGVDTAKETIYARLRNNEPGPAYVHFPVAPMFDEEYFEQLTAEKYVTKYVKGRPKRTWEKRRARNEALDISVYALAALYILNPNFKKLEERLHPEPEVEAPEEPVFTPKRTAVRRKPKQKKGFTNSWR